MGFGDGFAMAVIALAALYVAGAVCAWIWAPWWAALVLSAPLILIAIEAAWMLGSEVATRRRLR